VEVLDLLDNLEEMVNDAFRVPISNKVLLDAGEMVEILDRIRVLLPDELKQARMITREYQRILQDAEQQAKRIIDQAHDEKSKLAHESEVVKEAQVHAEDIIRQAEEMARQIREGATDYALDILSRLEGNLSHVLEELKSGQVQLRDLQQKNRSGQLG